MIKDIIIHLEEALMRNYLALISETSLQGTDIQVRRNGWLRQGPRADAWATPKARWASPSSTARRKRFARGRGARKYREGEQQKAI